MKKWLIVTVADCTGHGVPGAFMSMLGISFLNEIVRKDEVIQASHVLDHLRHSIIDALKQKGDSEEHPSTTLRVQDGMDISLMALNVETLECQFAGANNPLWICINCDSEPSLEPNQIVSSKIEGIPPNQSNIIEINRENLYSEFKEPVIELVEIKPDKMPVAIYDNMKPFSNHIINLCKGDVIYLASDGYEDQFGGPKNKKFLSRNLKEILKKNSNKPMNTQKEILETILEKWKGFNEQIDDITIMGIRI